MTQRRHQKHRGGGNVFRRGGGTGQASGAARATTAQSKKNECAASRSHNLLSSTEALPFPLSGARFENDRGDRGDHSDGGSDCGSVEDILYINDDIQNFLFDSSSSDDEELDGDDVGLVDGSTRADTRPFLFPVALAAPAGFPPHLINLATGSKEEVKNTRRKRQRVSVPSADDTNAGESHHVPTLRSLRKAAPSALLPPAENLDSFTLTVVLDIDETLVFARQGPVYMRPFVAELLRTCHDLRCELVIWTASQPEYVNPILNALGRACGRADWFHHIICRHKKWFSENADVVKDLRMLGRPLSRVVMVENNPLSAVWQPHNTILVEDYVQPNEADQTLLVVAAVLRRCVARVVRATVPPLAPPQWYPPTAVSLADYCGGRRRSCTNALRGERALIAVSFADCRLAEHPLRDDNEGDADECETPVKRAKTERSTPQSPASTIERDDSPRVREKESRDNGTGEDETVTMWALWYSPSGKDVQRRSYGCQNPV